MYCFTLKVRNFCFGPREKKGCVELIWNQIWKRDEIYWFKHVATTLQQKSNTSKRSCNAQEIPWSFNTPVRTVHKILQNMLHCFPTKFSNSQDLPSCRTCRSFWPTRTTNFCSRFFSSRGIKQWKATRHYVDRQTQFTTVTVSILRIAEYGQLKIHLDLSQYFFKSGAGL